MCCAAGLAVLAEIKRLGLREAASTVGAHLRERLQALAATPEGVVIGDIRGMGLFLGIELVRDRQTKEPATIETSWVCSHLKDRHCILTSVDGVYDNVMVLKPPMVFGVPEADIFVDALQRTLCDLRRVDLSTVTHTPT